MPGSTAVVPSGAVQLNCTFAAPPPVAYSMTTLTRRLLGRASWPVRVAALLSLQWSMSSWPSTHSRTRLSLVAVKVHWPLLGAWIQPRQRTL